MRRPSSEDVVGMLGLVGVVGLCVLLAIFFAHGWNQGSAQAMTPGLSRVEVAHNVDKFQDGNVTCYVYVYHGISCVQREGL